ncbi:hypothetical protein A2U01_0093946, partial [Trifolium medium]|nr:hypothetical protein [Trifolium medium]
HFSPGQGWRELAKIRQEKISLRRVLAMADEHLATCRPTSPGDLSRTGKLARFRWKARR